MPDKPEIAVGLDAGSAQTRCLILAMEDGRLGYLGHGEVESTGWSKSRLVDQKALTACVQSAVRRAEMEAHVPVDAMVVGIGGSGIDGHNSRGLYEFGRPRAVTLDDMAYAVERSEQVRLEQDRAILHLFPQDFTVDGRSGKRYPRGSTCSRLEANVHIVTLSQQEHDSIVAAVQQASYAIEETMFEPVGAGYSALSQEDRDRGVAIVDIGKHSTDLVVYDGEAVLLARSLPISADHFTRDVAVGLTVQYDDAERLKDLASEAPVIRLVNQLIARAANSGARRSSAIDRLRSFLCWGLPAHTSPTLSPFAPARRSRQRAAAASSTLI